MRLLKESETKEKMYFMSPLAFLESELEIPKELAYENVMIKGSVRTGKTTKVLIPLFKEFEHGKMYISPRYTQSEQFSDEDIIIYDLSNPSPEFDAVDLVEAVLNGESVFIHLDLYEYPLKSAEFLNTIFDTFVERKSEVWSPILIACDDISDMPRIETLVTFFEAYHGHKRVDRNKIYLASTLCYTRQLLQQYSEEEIEQIKTFVNMVDVEKQPIIS